MTVYRYFWACRFYFLVFFCFSLFSCWFRAVNWVDSCQVLSARKSSISYRITFNWVKVNPSLHTYTSPPGGPHRSTRGIRLVSTQGTIKAHETSHHPRFSEHENISYTCHFIQRRRRWHGAFSDSKITARKKRLKTNIHVGHLRPGYLPSFAITIHP